MSVINNPVGASYTITSGYNTVTIDNAGTVISSSDYAFLDGTNTGTIDVQSGTLDANITNSGIINVASGGTLGLIGADNNNTGGTILIAPDAVVELFSAYFYLNQAGEVLQGGVIRSNGGTLQTGAGTIADAELVGSFVTSGLELDGPVTFLGLGPGAPATVQGGLSFANAATASNVSVLLTPATSRGITGAAALTLANSTSVTFAASAATSDEDQISGASLTLDGSIGALTNGGTLTLSTTAGNLVIAGTVQTASGESLFIQPTGGSLVLSGNLDVASGTRLRIDTDLSAATFNAITNDGSIQFVGGTLSGDGLPGDNTITLTGSNAFSIYGTLRNVTVDATGSFAPYGTLDVGALDATLDNVTWIGTPLDVSDSYATIMNGLTVKSANGGAGTIVVGGTNTIVTFENDETLNNVTLNLGQTLDGSGTQDISFLEGSSSNLTIGQNAALNISGNEEFLGFDNVNTLTLEGAINIGPPTSQASASIDLSSSEPEILLSPLPGNVNIGPYGTVPQIFADEIHFEQDMEIRKIDIDLGKSSGNSSPGGGGQSVVLTQEEQNDIDIKMKFAQITSPLADSYQPQLQAEASSPPSGITAATYSAYETTLEGAGVITLDSGAGLNLDATVQSGITFSFVGQTNFLLLLDPANMAGTISGFGALGLLDLALDGFTGGAPTYSGNQLTIPTAVGNVTLNLSFAPGYSVADVRTDDDSYGGTLVYIPGAAADTIPAGLPDVSASFTTAVNTDIVAEENALLPVNTTPNVSSIAGGGVAAASVAGVLNALVVTSAGAGSVITLPAGYTAGFLLGGAATLADTIGGAELIDATANATLIGAATDTLFGGNAGATLLATSGAETVFGGTGANLLELGAANAVANTLGTDTIVGSTASDTVNASGAPLFFGASGTTLFNALGTTATLVGGGAETVNAGAASALLFAGAGGVDFTAGSGASTVVGGAGGNTLTGGSGATLYFGNGSNFYAAGAAVDTVVGFQGSLSGTGGANGTLFFTGTGGGSDVSTGAGSSTLIGFGAGDSLSAAGSGSDVIEAAAASETVDASASSGTNTFFVFGQNDVVLAGSGSTAVQSYVGNQTLAAGSGADLFAIVDSGQRAVTLLNFIPGQDFVQLQGYDAGAGAAALPSAVISGGSEVLTLPDGTTLTFQGVTGLTSGSFV